MEKIGGHPVKRFCELKVGDAFKFIYAEPWQHVIKIENGRIFYAWNGIKTDYHVQVHSGRDEKYLNGMGEKNQQWVYYGVEESKKLSYVDLTYTKHLKNLQKGNAVITDDFIKNKILKFKQNGK